MFSADDTGRQAVKPSIITYTRRLKQRLWALKSFITNRYNLVIRQFVLVSHLRGPAAIFSRTVTQHLFDIPGSLKLSCRNNTMDITEMVRDVIYPTVALILLTVITWSSGNFERTKNCLQSHSNTAYLLYPRHSPAQLQKQ